MLIALLPPYTYAPHERPAEEGVEALVRDVAVDHPQSEGVRS